jgi:hypothetical protein
VLLRELRALWSVRARTRRGASRGSDSRVGARELLRDVQPLLDVAIDVDLAVADRPFDARVGRPDITLPPRLECARAHAEPVNRSPEAVLRNKLNGRTTEVGNVCVKKFLGLPSEKIFQALHRVASDDSKALNAEAIQHAYDRSWINDWEKTFYFDTMRKRKLSDKQRRKRKQINRLVLRQTRRRRSTTQRDDE